MWQQTKSIMKLAKAALFVSMLLGPPLATSSALAQERPPDSDGERGDSDDRRARFRSWRRDRSEGDGARESSDRRSEDPPTMNMTDYAKGLVKQYDKNGNMMLDGDERRELRGRAASADANNDQVITVEELVARLSSPSSSTSSTPSSSAAGSGASTNPSSSTPGDDDESSDRRVRDRGGFFGFRRGERGGDSGGDRAGEESKSLASKRVLTWKGGGVKSGEEEKNKRRTYRFTPARERLPSDLPSWFKSQDKNGDGQVAMSEYSQSWTKSTVAKFRGYDLNDDGIVTAKEATKK
ncbi:MAG: hypothetical protein L0228_17360 [Planctomycetes bacterium]|nr:hypothetical protein [Planctomycetota bacterium]